MQAYRELTVWQRSIELVEEVYRIIEKLPSAERFALADQIKRSAVSIPSNIAEGRGRNTERDFVRFLSIANGSAFELETQLIICLRLGYVDEETCKKAFQLCDEVCRMLNSLIKKLKAKG